WPLVRVAWVTRTPSMSRKRRGPSAPPHSLEVGDGDALGQGHALRAEQLRDEGLIAGAAHHRVVPGGLCGVPAAEAPPPEGEEAVEGAGVRAGGLVGRLPAVVVDGVE